MTGSTAGKGLHPPRHPSPRLLRWGRRQNQDCRSELRSVNSNSTLAVHGRYVPEQQCPGSSTRPAKRGRRSLRRAESGEPIRSRLDLRSPDAFWMWLERLQTGMNPKRCRAKIRRGTYPFIWPAFVVCSFRERCSFSPNSGLGVFVPGRQDSFGYKSWFQERRPP
jgi:hypothetical protein